MKTESGIDPPPDFRDESLDRNQKNLLSFSFLQPVESISL